MSDPLLDALAAYIPSDRVAQIINPERALADEGVALIADISGFTPLTEALTRGLSADHGAEELTRALDNVFTALMDEIYPFRGSVMKFSGDALIIWYPRPRGGRRSTAVMRALTSAWRMQQAIAVHGRIPTPIGIVELRMKIGLTYGPVRRFRLGDPAYGYEDVLCGATLDRMAEAEHHADPGEILLDRATLGLIDGAVEVGEWRDGFAVAKRLISPARAVAWRPFAWPEESRAGLAAELAAYVPRPVYELLEVGRTEVAELKSVVSLFVQFHGIQYDSDPDVGDKLQTYFTTAQHVVARYDGRLNRLITGDKGSLIHIIFGAPRAVENQEERAVRCALDLQRECGGLPFISMQRIGISAGRVFAGPVGAPHRHDYTTMGDSINLSARLMQNAADNQILIEATVREALDDSFELADLGAIMVKGKSQPIAVSAPLGLRARAYRAFTPDQPMFGRDQALRAASSRFARAAAGAGSLVVITGPVGMGKTLLLQSLRAQSTLPWVDGIGLAYGQTLSGYLIIAVLRDLLNLPEGAPPPVAAQRLAQFCRDLFGPSRLEATYPYLARFMGLPLPAVLERRIEGLAGESLRWQLFAIIDELFRLLLRRGPLVIALDDLQWADPTSLAIVERLLRLLPHHPLLFCLSMRPERASPAWQLRQNALARLEPAGAALDISLDVLDETAAAALVGHMLPEAPPAVADQVIAKAAGNPLFLVEIIRTIKAYLQSASQDEIAAFSLEQLNLPDSVQGLLLAQIDRLEMTARHTLQMASVIGKTFLYSVLDALATGDQHLVESLAELEDGELVQIEDLESFSYTFRHHLIQESVYSTLLYERRRAYHRQVAAIIERLFPDVAIEQAGLLGFHYEQADDLSQASTLYLRAADQARLLSANSEAEALYARVLRLLDQQAAAEAQRDARDRAAEDDLRARTFLKLAQVRANLLDFAGAQEFYDQAFAIFEAMEATRPASAAFDAGHVLRMSGDEPETLDPGLAETTGAVEAIRNIFEGLLELDMELNVIPALARRWSVDADGRRYRFELRRDARWSDGRPLTAHDVVFAWRRNLDPATNAPLAAQLYVVEGAEAFHQGQSADPAGVAVRAIDDHTLEVTLAVPVSHFPYVLTDPITYPQPAHAIERFGADWSQPPQLVCNGCWVVADWRPGEALALERNPNYRGLAIGNLGRAVISFAPGSVEEYLAGRLDYLRVEDAADILDRFQQPGLRLHYLETFFLGFLCDRPPFASRELRRAFASSIDRKALVREVWAEVQKPAMGGLIPAGMPGHSPEIGLDFAPAAAARQARAALAQARPTITLAALPGIKTTPEFLRRAWREHLGIEVEVLADLPPHELLDRIEEGAVQMVILGWNAEYPHPDPMLRSLFHSASPMNYLHWSDRAFDELLDQAAQSADPALRLNLYHQADRLLVAEEAAIVPLFYRQAYGLLRPGFRIDGADRVIRGGSFKLKQVVLGD